MGPTDEFCFLFYQSDKAIQQELDHAKAQCLDAQRAEKLLKVDFQQLEKKASFYLTSQIKVTWQI